MLMASFSLCFIAWVGPSPTIFLTSSLGLITSSSSRFFAFKYPSIFLVPSFVNSFNFLSGITMSSGLTCLPAFFNDAASATR